MPRATNAPSSRQRRKRILKRARGFKGARSKHLRMATEAVDRAMRLATIHRKQKKRNYRSLWITRISAACHENNISYNRFIEGLSKANVKINRKILSEIAIHDPSAFSEIVNLARTELAGC